MPNDPSVELYDRLHRALAKAPLFAPLTPQVREAVERMLSLVAIPGGEPLFMAGEESDALYVVASGCLGVFDPDQPPERSLIAEIPPGEIVGEMSLLGHRKRSLTVAALRDTEAWRLEAHAFEKLIGEHPEALSGLMAKIVARAAAAPRRSRQPRTFAILPVGPGVPDARFSVELGAALAGQQPGAYIQQVGPDAMGRPTGWFQSMEAEATFTLYRADAPSTDWTRLCMRQADCLLFVGHAGDAPGEAAQRGLALERHLGDSPYRARRELVLLHDRDEIRAGSTRSWLVGHRFALHHHVRLGGGADMGRLARLLTNRAVGVVMAGGGARGFAHIGVAHALRAAGVPIDMTGGASMGAVVAAGVAAGWSDEELVERFRAAFVETNPLSDYTLPFVSLFRGGKVTRLLRAAFGDLDIEDLRRPFYCVTANLTSAQPSVHRSGPLWRWLRASVSIPGVLPPFIDRGEVHVDGGVIDNFPVTPMRALGRGAIVGADIETGGALAAGADVVEPWSAREFVRRLIWRRGETLPIPSIVRILLRSALVSSSARALQERDQADLVILPPMIDIDLLDWTSFDRAIRLGREATEKALEKARGLPVGARIFVG